MASTSTTAHEHPDLPPEFVPLHDDASPHEKDRHWYETCYMGDKMPQLTFRAVAMGAVLGMLMSISNLYTTLKVGWSFGVAITSCVLSFVIWNTVIKVLGGRVSNMSVLENNCMQSTASAAGYSTGSTIATAFGALLILDPAHQHQPWWIVASFTFATGALGSFMSVGGALCAWLTGVLLEVLHWRTADAPATLLPPLQALRATLAQKAQAFDGIVNEYNASWNDNIKNTAWGTVMAVNGYELWEQGSRGQTKADKQMRHLLDGWYPMTEKALALVTPS